MLQNLLSWCFSPSCVFVIQFGASTLVIIKEGSIGSLSVKMPWQGKGFQVEVDELELVLAFAPCPRNKSPAGNGNNVFNQDSNHYSHWSICEKEREVK